MRVSMPGELRCFNFDNIFKYLYSYLRENFTDCNLAVRQCLDGFRNGISSGTSHYNIITITFSRLTKNSLHTPLNIDQNKLALQGESIILS